MDGHSLRLCGRLELWLAGERADARLRDGQVVTLLAVLALAQPHALRRDELIDVLWPETLPSDAGAMLSTLLSRLRRVVPLEGRAELRLSVEPHLQVDVEIAREALVSGRSALAEGRWSDADATGGYAAAIVAGEFLPGISGTWVERRREEVRGLEADALEVMVEGRLRAGGDAECRLWELGDRLEQGRADALEPVADTIERTARDAQRPRWHAWPALLRTTAALAHGRFDAAAAQLAAADRRGAAPGSAGLGALADEPEWLARRTLLALAHGGLETVEPAVARTADRLPALPLWRALHAWVLLRAGRPAHAQAAFDRFARRNFADVPGDMYLVVACAVAAEVCDPPRAETLYDLLLPYRDRHAVAPVDFTLGSVERSLGLLAATTGELDTADEHLTRAARANARLRPWLAETELAHARVLIARNAAGDNDRALALARHGRATARALGMTALLNPGASRDRNARSG